MDTSRARDALAQAGAEILRAKEEFAPLPTTHGMVSREDYITGHYDPDRPQRRTREEMQAALDALRKFDEEMERSPQKSYPGSDAQFKKRGRR